MISIPVKGRWAAMAVALGIAACSPTATDPAATDAVDPAPEASESSAADRRTKAAMLEEFNQALAQAQETSGPGTPALWSLSDEDTVIHIFGTVHLLRPDLDWRTETFDTALAAADTVVFEVDMNSPEAQRLVMSDFLSRGMYQDGRTLKQVLNEEDESVVSAAFDSLGVPIDAMNAFEPWMASVNLGVMKLVNDGYDPGAGVESVIEAEAVAAGKSFAFLESISQQADAFDLLPEDEQIAMLYETAILLDESPQMLDVLVGEWADGDVAGIAALVASPDGVGFTDAAYEALLTKRNLAWVPQIEAMLDTPGAVFIAVGAGHLAGPDSVITMLRDKGYTVEGP